VHPAEVESTLLQMEGVTDVVVRGQPNPLTGQIVLATVQLSTGETADQFKLRMRQFCSDRLASYKIPARVQITDKPVYSARFKRVRKSDAASIHEPT
jgi:acyl-coenzyme A synthetase/AMP-(fatty) acid ligase